ncbi:MAG: DUF2157 domain-containing protein [Syntrophaceae bacterium]|nr:DUF2157 domain-containing protein [Syntrophaceae bacterium]
MSPGREDISFQRRLEKEAEIWVEEGLISPIQRDRIVSRYRVLKEADEKAGPGKLITTLSILGSILVGVGVILFVASNWSLIPKWGKLGIIFSSMMASYGFGFYFRYEKASYPRVGASLILLGSLIFGAGMFLITQIYHITVHYPNGPLMWGLGVLPLGYLLGFKSLISLAILDLLIWLGMEARFWISHSSYYGMMTMVNLYLIAGIALWGIGLMHREWRSLRAISSPYIILGSLITFSGGYLLTFEFFGLLAGSNTLWMFYTGITALFLLSVVMRFFSKEREKGWGPEVLGLLILTGIVLYLSLSSPPGPPKASRPDLRLFFNILFALEIFGLIILGFVRRYPAYVNIGVLFFALDVIARYFDLFWKLLPRSLFFIVGGLLLLLGGIMLERKRRRVLASFNIEEADG